MALMTERANEMKRVSTSEQINVDDWTFFDGDEDFTVLLAKALAASVTKTLRKVFDENPPKLDLAFAWAPDSDGCGGACPTDPAMLYVSLPLTRDEYESVYFACSLEGAIDDLIELHEDTDGKVSDDGREICGKVAARLRELADKLEDACK